MWKSEMILNYLTNEFATTQIYMYFLVGECPTCFVHKRPQRHYTITSVLRNAILNGSHISLFLETLYELPQIESPENETRSQQCNSLRNAQPTIQ